MIAPQPHETCSDQPESTAVQPVTVRPSLDPAAKAGGPSGYRLSGLVPGRPYCLGSPDERDETVRQVRAYFGHVDFWEPV